LKNTRFISITDQLKPYFVIAIAALLAYLPVSSMLFSLKNDVLAIEYPIQHFMSESLRNGESPVWFNTWSMGFPLQSILTWGVYSTPQMLTGFFFESNIYILHIEFLFFIMASGWCMYKLLKTHFLKDRQLALLLACCYMLSGFTVGSSQWLLYITGMTFIPLCIYCLLSLLKQPSFKYALLFAVAWYLFFTNVHIYLTVVSTYILFFSGIIYFIRLSIDKVEKRKLYKFVSLAMLFTVVLCAAPAYYTLETISHLQRSLPLASNSTFFQSNFVHPDALSSFLLPLSSIKTTHFNTEGTVLDVYIGLLPFLLLPATLFLNLKQKNTAAWGLLIASFFFLLVSFGHLTPIRGWLNILPGMGHFRHPGVLRIFFNLSFILYLAQSLKNHSLSDLLMKGSNQRKKILFPIVSLLLLSLLTMLLYSGNLKTVWKDSFYSTVKNSSNGELVLVSAVIQVCFTAALLFSITRKKQLFSFLILAELVVNTLICTPFFTVSTYSAKEVESIFQNTKGFPVQRSSPSEVPAVLTDAKNNSWDNINTYRKEVSNSVSKPGPLIMESVATFIDAEKIKRTLAGKQLVFLKDSIGDPANSIRITKQVPSEVIAEVSLAQPREIVLQQAAFPGWKASYNNAPIPLIKNDLPFVSVRVPAGTGTIVFKFEKKGVGYSALLLHLIVIITLLIYTLPKLRFRSSSLS